MRLPVGPPRAFIQILQSGRLAQRFLAASLQQQHRESKSATAQKGAECGVQHTDHFRFAVEQVDVRDQILALGAQLASIFSQRLQRFQDLCTDTDSNICESAQVGSE